ncbi:MAG: GNAT family N-acetyltransferase [Paenalcaligenes sp.]
MINYRAAIAGDVNQCIEIRGLTRENAFSREDLAELGITAETWAAGIEQGESFGYVCSDNQQVVGYCFGEVEQGEILVLALLPEYENQGIGKKMLELVMNDMQAAGLERLFLSCAADSQVRSYGFYRYLGWASTGEFDDAGDEILEYCFK